MKGLILLIQVILTVNALPGLYLKPYSSKVLTDNQRSHCDSLCTTYDGVFDFDEKQKTCICYVGKYFDDTDITLMRKNAKTMGMKLKTIKTSPKILSKRESIDGEASPAQATTTEAAKKKSFSSMKKGSIFSINPKEKQFQLPASKLGQNKKESESEPSKKEGIVGAARGQVNINTRANSRPTPLQPGAMKDVWVKARQRLDHLIKHSDGGKFNSRFAQSETQSIRNALKPLTLKGKATAPKPLGRNSGGGLIGGGQQKHGLLGQSKGLKVAGKPTSVNFKPFSNQPNKPLSGNGKIGPASSLFNKPNHIKSRMGGHHNLVGAAQTGAEVLPDTATTSTTEKGGVKEKAVDKFGKEVAAKKYKTGNGKDVKSKQDDVDNNDSALIVQPDLPDEDFMEKTKSNELGIK